MMELPLDRPAGILIKTTLVDYPGHVAGSFFLKGCNLRCPYCYNIGLVLPEISPDGLSTVQELFDHLEKRRNVLSGLVISGGEPLINSYTPLIIQKAKELGYKVKIDTNGLLPDKLQAMLDDENLKPDFIALDIKTNPSRYAEVMCGKYSYYSQNPQHIVDLLTKSIKIVSSLPAESREFRTVLVPPLVQKEDIKQIAELLPADASWQFAQFQNSNCLDPSYNEIYPYTDSEANELIEYAKTFIRGAALR